MAIVVRHIGRVVVRRVGIQVPRPASVAAVVQPIQDVPEVMVRVVVAHTLGIGSRQPNNRTGRSLFGYLPFLFGLMSFCNSVVFRVALYPTDDTILLITLTLVIKCVRNIEN